MAQVEPSRTIGTLLLALFPALLLTVAPPLGAQGEDWVELVVDGGFESEAGAWTRNGDFHADDRFPRAREGSGYAYLSHRDGSPANGLRGSLSQTLRLPNRTEITLSFWTNATVSGSGLDALHVIVEEPDGTPLETLALLTGREARRTAEPYARHTADLTHYAGREVRLVFRATTDAHDPTVFRLDDVSVRARVLPAAMAADPPDPEVLALADEMAHRWPEAADRYRAILADEPQRTDLWLRLSDVEAARGRPVEAAEALLRAAGLEPERPELWARASVAWAVVPSPAEALTAVQRAVRLAPDDPDHLRAQARLANWNAQYVLARESLLRLQALGYGDADVELGLARVAHWSGHSVEASERYRTYLERHPETAEAWVEAARVEAGRGDHTAALAILERSLEHHAASPAFLEEHAATLAAVGWPRSSLTTVEPLLADHPESARLHRIHALAQAASGRPRGALASLDTLDSMGSADAETRLVERVVRTPLRSWIEPRYELYDDSDSVRRSHAALAVEWALAPGTRFSARAFDESLEADPGSGLAASIGSGQLDLSGVAVGLQHRLGPAANLRLEIGDQEIEFGPGLTTYDAALELAATDRFQVELRRALTYHAVSPRAVELGIERTENRLGFEFRPDARYTLVGVAAYDRLSDGNRRREFQFAPRRAFVRRQRVNLDLGLAARWLEFDFDPGNGYYAPRDYRRFGGSLYLYAKLADDHGVSLVLSPGVFRDETVRDYEFTGDASVEFIFGIYNDWSLRVRGGFTENARQASGAFNATSGRFSLQRRF